MKSSICLSRLLLPVVLLALASGCTHAVKMNVKPTALSGGQKLPHEAVIVIGQGLADYKYEFRMMGDKWVFPFGTPLQDYARNVARASFTKVGEAPSVEKAAEHANADLILIPRALKADQGVGVWAWNDINFTLVVEWVAKDRARQNTVWLKTLTAEASEKGGNMFTGKKHQQILMQKLFDDLSIKTFDAIQNAPELKGPLSSGGPNRSPGGIVSSGANTGTAGRQLE